MAILDRAAKLRRPRAVLVQHPALPRLAFALAAMPGSGRLPARAHCPFRNPAALADNAFVAADPALLAEALCIEEARVVARDNTVVYDSRRLNCPRAKRAPTTSRRG
jgi:hypothetical protein